MVDVKPAILVVLSAAAAYAQSPPLTPAPPVLEIYRDFLRPGRLDTYTVIETRAAEACARLHCPHPYLALTSATGPVEVWFLNGFDSLTEMEQIGKAYAGNAELSGTLRTIAGQKNELINDPRNIIASYRSDLSAGRGLSVPRTHLYSVSIVTVQPGKEGDFAEIRKILRSARHNTNSPEVHSVYQVASGMPEPTFFVFSPATSLEDVENSAILYKERFEESLGDANRKRLADLSASAIVRLETFLLSIAPPMSLPAQEWVDSDPEFWKHEF
jgi:hypothetical protein